MHLFVFGAMAAVVAGVGLFIVSILIGARVVERSDGKIIGEQERLMNRRHERLDELESRASATDEHAQR